MLSSKYGMHLREPKEPVQSARHLEFLKTLTLLLLQEIENLADIPPSNSSEETPTVNSRADAADNELRNGSIDLSDQVRQFEIALICDALLECEGNQTRTAKKLRMKNSTLHAKIRRYKIRFERSRLGWRASAD
jgi:DNA-binding NtrC family response regulator